MIYLPNNLPISFINEKDIISIFTEFIKYNDDGKYVYVLRLKTRQDEISLKYIDTENSKAKILIEEEKEKFIKNYLMKDYDILKLYK